MGTRYDSIDLVNQYLGNRLVEGQFPGRASILTSTADMARRAAQRAERQQRKELAAMAKAAAEAARALDGGDGAYDGATAAQKMALMRAAQ